jgi:cystathionine gamma-synthase
MAKVQLPDTHPFGVAVPFADRTTDHNVLTHLPEWENLLKFVAGDPMIFQRVVNFYPRVLPQEHVKKLSKALVDSVEGSEGKTCMIFTDPGSPKACIDFITSDTRKDAKVSSEGLSSHAFDVGPHRFWTIFYPIPTSRNATGEFWQTPGIGVSTRQAQDALKYLDQIKEIPLDSLFQSPTAESETIAQQLRERIISYVNRAPLTTTSRPESSDVYLFPTGMGAFYRLHHYLTAHYNLPTVAYGFPFHNTKDLFEWFPSPSPYLFLGNGDAADLAKLKAHLATLHSQGTKIQALWTEFPSNPACITPDLHSLRQLADEYKFILIVDDTIGGTANVDVLAAADILITSLTKAFSGYADVMGGSVVLSPASPFYTDLKSILSRSYRNEMHWTDAQQLLLNSENYLERSAIHNTNGAALATYFAEEAAKPNSQIAKVYHPLTLPDSLPFYKQYLRPSTPDFPNPGYGLLLTVDFVNEAAQAAFYDAVKLLKSPHLGCHVTLVLPYVKGVFGMLGQLEEVAEWGITETQMRIAPGLEDAEGLVGEFRRAMGEAERVVAEAAKEVPLQPVTLG